MDNNFEILSNLLAKYGWTAEEAMENIGKASQALANYYIEGSAQVKNVLNQVYNLAIQTQPDTDAKTENSNEKSLLEISRPKEATFTATNSKWDKDLLSKEFGMVFDDILDITYDDDWIKEALDEK